MSYALVFVSILLHISTAVAVVHVVLRGLMRVWWRSAGGRA